MRKLHASYLEYKAEVQYIKHVTCYTHKYIYCFDFHFVIFRVIQKIITPKGSSCFLNSLSNKEWAPAHYKEPHRILELRVISLVLRHHVVISEKGETGMLEICTHERNEPLKTWDSFQRIASLNLGKGAPWRKEKKQIRIPQDSNFSSNKWKFTGFDFKDGLSSPKAAEPWNTC